MGGKRNGELENEKGEEKGGKLCGGEEIEETSGDWEVSERFVGSSFC